MKKNIFIISMLWAAMFLTGNITSAKAQVFILDDHEFNSSHRARYNDNGTLPNPPELDVTYDQYAPLGSGVLVLGCLGGAYLLGKRRKKE